MNNSSKSRTLTKKQIKGSTSAVTTDFGNRKIVGQNFSKMISLPKTALKNLGSKSKNLKVELIQDKGERYIKLSPVRGGKK